MNIGIIGGGSIGLLFAAKLALAGERITVWTRTEAQARELNERGLTLLAEGQAYSAAVQARCLDKADGEAEDGKPKVLLLTVKQPDITGRLIDKLGVLTEGPGSILIGLQNGIGHIERLKEGLPGVGVAAAVTTEGASRQSYSSVAHTGSGELWMGPAESAEERNTSAEFVENRQKMFLDSLNGAGFRAGLSNEMNDRIFQKLLINAVINPLTAIYDVCNGELPKHPFRLRLMQALCEETSAVLTAAGFRQENGWDKVLGVCEATAANVSSMLSDVRAGRQTEIAWINGGVAELARRYGLKAPLNEGLTELVLSLAPAGTGGRTEP